MVFGDRGEVIEAKSICCVSTSFFSLSFVSVFLCLSLSLSLVLVSLFHSLSLRHTHTHCTSLCYADEVVVWYYLTFCTSYRPTVPLKFVASELAFGSIRECRKFVLKHGGSLEKVRRGDSKKSPGWHLDGKQSSIK